MTSTDHARRRLQSLGALAIYFAAAVLLLDRGLRGHPGYMIGRDTDPGVHMWFFNWWRFAIAHRLNPFITDWVWAPLGINLAWTTCVPLPSLVSIPLQLTVGEPATYNIMVTLMPPLAAFSAFALCRRVTGALWPSILCGYIFGFSPYMLGQLLAHLVEIAIFPVPLIVLVTLKRLDQEISTRLFAVLLAALLTVQYLCSVEHFATVTMVGGFALLLALALFHDDRRARLLGLIAPIAAGYLMAIAILSPYLYFMLAYGFPHSPIWKLDIYSADLLAFLVPCETVMLGTARAATNITRTFQGDIYENGAYLGIAIVIFVEVFRRRYWREPVGKFLTILFVVLAIAAMGPVLHVAGKQGIWMPWALFQRLPLLSIALPIRFMTYAFLVVAVMVAMWFSASPARPLTKWIAAAVIVVSLAPNLHASFWVSPLDIPAFFTDRTYAAELQPREIILPLPWGQRGNSMYWQLQSDMYFRMAGGWTGISPFEFARMPVANYFYGGRALPEAKDQLKAYVARFGVTAIVADPSYGRLRTFQPALEALGVTAEPSGGALIYRIPAGKFGAYAKLTGADVEGRALALRFDTVLAAASNYISGGDDPLKLSPLELKRLNLLPPEWQIDTAPDSLRDWSIGGFSDNRIGIVLLGSAQGMKPLLDRYFGKVDELQFPAPSRWSPHSSPPEDRLDKLLMIFGHPQLETPAAQLKSSPPPQMKTPFR